MQLAVYHFSYNLPKFVWSFMYFVLSCDALNSSKSDFDTDIDFRAFRQSRVTKAANCWLIQTNFAPNLIDRKLIKNYLISSIA